MVPAVEETCVPEPAGARDDGVVVAVTAQMAPVVQLPESSEEFGDSWDIDPAAAASAADRVTKFISSSKEVLGTQVYEELGGDNNWVIVQSGAPSDIAQTEQGGGGDWRA